MRGVAAALVGSFALASSLRTIELVTDVQEQSQSHSQSQSLGQANLVDVATRSHLQNLSKCETYQIIEALDSLCLNRRVTLSQVTLLLRQ